MIQKKSLSVCLLGGGGFLGQNIYDTLDSHFRCITISHSKPKFTSNQNFILLDPYQKPISCSCNAYIQLIDNQNSIQKECQLVQFLPKEAHIILISSSVVYADPNSLHAQRKQFLEELYKENFKNLTILRVFNSYGPYQVPYRPGSLIANIFYNYLRSQPIKMSKLSLKRDFVFSKDIGKWIQLALENKIYGIFDVATGIQHSLQEVLDYIETITDSSLSIILERKQEGIVGPKQKLIFPIAISTTSLLEGLKKTWGFFKDPGNKSIYDKLI